jgi:glycogen debranching enzyme
LPKADVKAWERVISDIQILPSNDPIFNLTSRPSIEDAIQMILGNQNGFKIPFAAVPLNHHLRIPEQNLFRCLFGRDSLLIANLLSARLPNLETNVVKALGAVQGVKYNDRSEEEPGRIPHEVRDSEDARAKVLVANGNWQFPYYGSVDATLLWLKALANISRKDPTLLDYLSEGVPLWKRAISATEWILGRLETPSGLIESHRRNPRGIRNQVWKDSEDSYMHADGILAQGESTASIETVGETFDALRSAIEIQNLKPNHEWPASTNSLSKAATDLQLKLINLLWLGDRFALGTERLSDGTQKAFDSQASNQGRLLDSKILDGEEMSGYRVVIAAAVCDPQLLGESGLRTLSALHPSYRPGGYHTGSAWPMDAVFTSRGLTKHGFHRESLRLLNRTKVSIESIGGYPEFFRGDPTENGLITAQITDVISERDNAACEVNRVCQPPQMIQGWTVAAYAWIVDNIDRIAAL